MSMDTKLYRTDIAGPKRPSVKVSDGCSVCGGRLPKGTTFMEAVLLTSEQAAKKWRFFCEGCLAQITEPYETRWDWEWPYCANTRGPKRHAVGWGG